MKMEKSANQHLSEEPKLRVVKADKAYDNHEFIHSADGRIIRILSEYLYPNRYLQKHKVKNTVVFFGSARTPSQDLYEIREKEFLDELKENPNNEEIKAKLEKLRHRKSNVNHYETARKLANLLSMWSKELQVKDQVTVCTGGGPGIMEAANRGAFEADERTIGLNISLPFEQYPNQYITPDLNFEFHYFYMRKFWFVYLAKALVVFPGGFGTLDELMEVLTLVQTKKVTKPLKILLFNKEFWTKLINFEYLAELGFINHEDLDLFSFFETAEEGFEILKNNLVISE